MKATVIGSTFIHLGLLAALFVVHPSRTLVLPGPDVVQVALIGDLAPPPPPAPVVKANDAVVPDENQGVQIEKPKAKPKPEVKQQPKPAPPNSKPATEPRDDTPPPAGANEGTRVEVYFRVSRSGEVSQLRVETGSGNDIFDDSAIRAVTITEQLPPLPLGYAGSDLGIHFGFEYTGQSQ